MDDDPPPLARPPSVVDIHVSSAVGRLPLSRKRVSEIAEQVLRGERCRSAMLAITFVDDREIARLHRRHFGVAGPTDIITFQHASRVRGGPLVADVYIAPAVARENARAAGCPVREEIARLTVHGVLHALGWAHPEGEGRMRSLMWRRQARWVERLRRGAAW